MHFSSLLLLPLLVAADQQPFMEQAQGWFDKAKSYVGSAVPDSPIDTAASKVANQFVEKVNLRNWERKLVTKVEGPEDWLMLVSGGNKSCFGRCAHVDESWNLAVPLIRALPSAPVLAYINCEKDEQLCTGLGAAVPSIWHLAFPKKSLDPAVPDAPTPLHITFVNTTTVTPQDFVNIVTDKTYLKQEEYKGALHPVDGALRKYGLLIPLGYVLWGFGSTPSWLIMIAISFFSRQYMGRKTARAMDARRAPPAAAAAAPPPPAARPANAGHGGRKRK